MIKNSRDQELSGRTAASRDSKPSFVQSLGQLRSAQKSSKGAPPYSLYINRPLGRVLAAAAYQARLTPNQVTYLSAAATFAGLAVLAVVPPSLIQGIGVAVLLVIGYALDSADGQLARLQGGGTADGEWLDHMIDAVKVSAVHLAVLIAAYRFFELPSDLWLLVPIGFSLVSAVHFFGMILVDQLARLARAKAGLGPAAPQPASKIKTLLKLPTDYGVLCLVFVLLGAPLIFFVAYTFLAVGSAGYLILVVRKWRKDVIGLGSTTGDPSTSKEQS